ncbi:MAG: hypothetical protein JWM95_4079 [Gemmatimonadetes bacterium]|nr:hypothetical protein [Gemmatimonadota bacterium]
MKFLGWVWIVGSVVGALGLFAAAQSDIDYEREYKYNIYRTAEPTWLSAGGKPLAFAVLLQGLTLGTFMITFANRGRKEL